MLWCGKLVDKWNKNVTNTCGFYMKVEMVYIDCESPVGSTWYLFENFLYHLAID